MTNSHEMTNPDEKAKLHEMTKPTKHAEFLCLDCGSQWKEAFVNRGGIWSAPSVTDHWPPNDARHCPKCGHIYLRWTNYHELVKARLIYG